MSFDGYKYSVLIIGYTLFGTAIVNPEIPLGAVVFFVGAVLLAFGHSI